MGEYAVRHLGRRVPIDLANVLLQQLSALTARSDLIRIQPPDACNIYEEERMSNRPGMFGFIDRMYFKPTEKGWLFKEPALWRRRTYLLTDTEKMRLVGPVRWMSFAALVLIVAGIQAQDFVADHLHVPSILAAVAIAAAAMTGFWIYTAVFFHPLLSGLMPTNERITFSDQMRMQAIGLPMSVMIVWLVACLTFVILGSGVAFLDGWDWKDAAGIALFAILGVYPVMLLVLRARNVQTVSQQETRN